MTFEQLHQAEMPWLATLQSIRGPFLDQVMLALNYLDAMTFYYLIIIAIWYAYDRKVGLQVLYLFLFCLLFGRDLKILFSQPRPSSIDPSLGLLIHPSFGFPSGAAETYAAFYAYLGPILHKRWFWMSGPLLVLLVSYSRIYLGLHFPSDILGGWLLGALIGLGCYAAFPRIEHYLSKQSKRRILELSLLAAVLLSLCSLSFGSTLGIVGAFGATVGFLWAPPLSSPKNLHQRFIRSAIAILGALLIILLHDFIRTYATHTTVSRSISAIGMFAMGLWVGGGVNLLSKKIGQKAHQKKGRSPGP